MPTEIWQSPTISSATSKPDQVETWWDRYCSYALKPSKFSETARAVIHADSRAIAASVSQSNHTPSDPERKRVRTGIVVGGVQSGKTASMLGVSALLLDEGVNILIVLAGTQITLWRQTYERFLDSFGEDGTIREKRRRLQIGLSYPTA